MAGKRILLVDDDDKIRTIVSDILGKAGYEVHATGDAKGAVRLAAQTRPDLAILDIAMPEMDGFELAFRLREDPATRKTPYLFLTAGRAAENLEAARDLGAVAYLEKPFRKESLLDLLRGLLRPES